MRTTSHGLTVWNDSTDDFDHLALAANWDLIDSYWAAFDTATQMPKNIRMLAAPPGSATAGDLCMLTARSGNLPAWSVIRYDGSSWLPVGNATIQSSLPGTPYAGQIVVLSSSVTNFAAWSVVRWDGAKWDHVGIFGYVNTGSGFNNIQGAEIGGDVYVNTSSRGIVLVDRVTGHIYRLYINNGTVSLESVS